MSRPDVQNVVLAGTPVPAAVITATRERKKAALLAHRSPVVLAAGVDVRCPEDPQAVP